MKRITSFFSRRTSPDGQSEPQDSKCGDLDYKKIDLVESREDIDPETKNYIEKRVLKKIIFFDCLKNREKNRHTNFNIFLIVLGAAVTAVNAIPLSESYVNTLRLVTSVLGAMIIIFTGIIHLNKYQEKMLSFKITLRELEKELFLFLQNSGKYSMDDCRAKKSLFTRTIEDILEKEALDYIAIFSPDKQPPDKQPPDKQPPDKQPPDKQPPVPKNQ